MSIHSLKRVLKYALLASVLFSSQLSFAKTITDLTGRQVEVPEKIERIALGESRLIYALALLQDNPIERVVGWRNDLERDDPGAYDKFAQKFPRVNSIPNLGNPYASDVNIEALVKDKPQVYILSLSKLLQAKETHLIEKLEKAGVATVFVDFVEKPLDNTVPSMEILGKLLGVEKRAEKFNTFYTNQMNDIKRRLANVKKSQKPLVFIERAAGLDPDGCCRTFGPYNFGTFVEAAGGINWGSLKISGFGGSVNPETIFTTPFDVIIGTGGNWKNRAKNTEAVPLGYDGNEKDAQIALQHLANRKGWSKIKAVKEKRFYSIYHQFYIGPYNFIGVQAIAKWLHPDLFRDVDPVENFKQFHKDFLPIDYSGIFWEGLK